MQPTVVWSAKQGVLARAPTGTVVNVSLHHLSTRPTGQRLAHSARRCHGIERLLLPPVAAAAAAADSGDSLLRPTQRQKPHGVGMLTPLNDPVANDKLLALSLAQCLASIATLMHDTYLPLYMRDVLQLSNTSMGNLHGLLQFVARASGVLSGRLADVLSPARMVLIGTALTAICKPGFALCGAVHAALGAAACWYWIAGLKIFDRTIKGIREAPSKALVGDLAQQCGDSPAAAFSLRQSLSTLGMLLGTTAASLAFSLSGKNYVTTFALSAIPASLGLLLVATAFGGSTGAAEAKAHMQSSLASIDEVGLAPVDKARAVLGALKAPYWQALATLCLLYTARFDVAFITIHAATVMDPAKLPILTAFSMAPVVVLATPTGMRAKASARERNAMMALGIAVLIAGDLCYALIPSMTGMLLGSLCVGVHMAMTQGVGFGMLATYIPSGNIPGIGRITGTVWSLTDLLLGIALACSNSLAGKLTDVTVKRGLGNTGCFLGGSVACAAALAALLLFSTFGSLGQEDLMRAA